MHAWQPIDSAAHCFRAALLVIALAWAAVAYAWPGVDWDAWREATEATRPAITAPQAGQAHLVPLIPVTDEADGARQAAWADREAAIRGALTVLLGAPTVITRDTAPAQAGEVVVEDGYTRTRVLIPGEVGDPIPAFLLTPAEPIAVPTPVMIVLHQTQAAGKDEAVGLSGNPEMAFAVALAQRGYICIAPDVIGFGERTPAGAPPYDGAMAFFARHPEWSFFGKMNWDLARVVDYIETLPGADAARIGVIGHSHGAYGALMSAAFEPRIAAVVASCGFTTLRADPNPERWSHLTCLLPRLGFYLDEIAQAPFDWHEVLGLIAPRPLYNWATLDDGIFPNTESLAEVYDAVRAVYSVLGAADVFTGRLEPGDHAFPRSERQAAYAWLDRQLTRPDPEVSAR